ncbi:hypothetical protein D9M71_534310 [compost metagenome]
MVLIDRVYGINLASNDLNISADFSELSLSFGIRCRIWVPAPIAVSINKKAVIDRSFATSPCICPVAKKPIIARVNIFRPPGDAAINKYTSFSMLIDFKFDRKDIISDCL